MSYKQRRFHSPPVFLTYESVMHHNRYSSRSPSPSSDSEGSHSDDESIRSEPMDHQQQVVGDMDMDLEAPVARPAPTHTGSHSSHTTDHAHDEDEDDEDDEDEESKREARRKLAEKRKGKRPEESPQQKAEAKAARRRARRLARAEAEEEAYRNAYRPILTIKSSQGFVWNQDLFIPAYQRERYLCSTSPSSSGMSPQSMPMAIHSAASGMDYEVECVEIRIREGEMESIVPRRTL